VPAFMISELKRAFEIGFLLFLPFLIVDLVVASVLMSMGHDDAATGRGVASVQIDLFRPGVWLEPGRGLADPKLWRLVDLSPSDQHRIHPSRTARLENGR
jgi:hypothetical protein